MSSTLDARCGSTTTATRCSASATGENATALARGQWGRRLLRKTWSCWGCNLPRSSFAHKMDASPAVEALDLRDGLIAFNRYIGNDDVRVSRIRVIPKLIDLRAGKYRILVPPLGALRQHGAHLLAVCGSGAIVESTHGSPDGSRLLGGVVVGVLATTGGGGGEDKDQPDTCQPHVSPKLSPGRVDHLVRRVALTLAPPSAYSLRPSVVSTTERRPKGVRAGQRLSASLGHESRRRNDQPRFLRSTDERSSFRLNGPSTDPVVASR
jgi:hypothetical protein